MPPEIDKDVEQKLITLLPRLREHLPGANILVAGYEGCGDSGDLTEVAISAEPPGSGISLDCSNPADILNDLMAEGPTKTFYDVYAVEDEEEVEEAGVATHNCLALIEEGWGDLSAFLYSLTPRGYHNEEGGGGVIIIDFRPVRDADSPGTSPSGECGCGRLG